MDEINRLYDPKLCKSRIISEVDGVWKYTDDNSTVPQHRLKGFFSNGLSDNSPICRQLGEINQKLDIIIAHTV
jgi:hypothetical protein